ncbi:MAG: hypothetical protein Q9172_002560 [Xanthocarpia lactea]
MGCRLSHITHSDEDRLVDRGERPTVRRTESKKRHVQAQIEKNGLLSIPLRPEKDVTATPVVSLDNKTIWRGIFYYGVSGRSEKGVLSGRVIGARVGQKGGGPFTT